MMPINDPGINRLMLMAARAFRVLGDLSLNHWDSLWQCC